MTALWAVRPDENILGCSVGALRDLRHAGHGGGVVLWGGGAPGRGGVVALEPGYGLAGEPLLVVVEDLLVVAEVGGPGVVAGARAGVRGAGLLGRVPHAVTSCTGLVPHTAQPLPLP